MRCGPKREEILWKDVWHVMAPSIHCFICSLFCQTTSHLAFRQRKQKKPFDSLLEIQPNNTFTFHSEKLLMMPNVIYNQQYGSLNILIN